MQKEHSLYLDVMRFLAAMVVFLGHTSTYKPITGGMLWQLAPYLGTAVMIFFVLSGYVIAFVVDYKKSNLTDYAVSRMARLYSIVVPALLLTFACNLLGEYLLPVNYLGPWDIDFSYIWQRYLTTLFMLQQVWESDFNPPNNGPFWSLSFEFFYYCFFGLFFYLKGSLRAVSLLFAMLLAGPVIVSYFPIWLMGFAAYKIQKRIVDFNGIILVSLSIFSLVGLLSIGPFLRSSPDWVISSFLTLPSAVADYFESFMFAIHLVCFPSILGLIRTPLLFLQQPIRWLASLSFALYLFHLPIMRTLTGLSPFESETYWGHRLLVIGGTFFLVAVIGGWCENQKGPLKIQMQRFMKKTNS